MTTRSDLPPDEQRDERRDEAVRPDDDDVEARIDAVTSSFVHPPTAEELRAAFGRRRPPDDEPPAPPAGRFASTYSAESLFAATRHDLPVPEEPDFEVDDRSRTKGDYFYDPADAWAVLGLRPGASWAEIARAHRRLAKSHHPDRLLDETPERRAASEDKMREINVAYSVLRRLTGN